MAYKNKKKNKKHSDSIRKENKHVKNERKQQRRFRNRKPETESEAIATIRRQLGL